MELGEDQWIRAGWRPPEIVAGGAAGIGAPETDVRLLLDRIAELQGRLAEIAGEYDRPAHLPREGGSDSSASGLTSSTPGAA